MSADRRIKKTRREKKLQARAKLKGLTKEVRRCRDARLLEEWRSQICAHVRSGRMADILHLLAVADSYGARRELELICAEAAAAFHGAPGFRSRALALTDPTARELVRLLYS